MIEKTVPIPSDTRKKYPIDEMEIGDSIFDEGCESTPLSKIRMAANKHGKSNGKKFTARKVEGGVRIWRVE